MQKLVLWITVFIAIQGCAAPPATPNVAEPTATIADTAVGGGRSGKTFFVLAEVDGRPVANSMGPSAIASSEQDPNLQSRESERKVVARRATLRLRGQITYPSPVQQIFLARRMHSVDGTIDVELKPNTSYRVTGILDSFRREIWLEEIGSGQVVGAKITAPADPAAAASSASGAMYTCCNLHYDGDWISDANYQTLPFIPAGSRIAINDYGRYRASVMIEGRPMRIGQDYGRVQESTEEYVTKLVLNEDPKVRIATFPANVQAAIRAGKVMPGMTREQVIMSLGPPRTDRTASIDLLQWTYWTTARDEFVVLWDTQHRVRAVDGATRVTRLVLYGETP
ncbi:MAG TPA: hypothetical protein VM937_12355 [Burkholderiaceae bacterium]|jgi:hypothetical protein|nr:hypothetical protein [Burkholderiaceae bacterium]